MTPEDLKRKGSWAVRFYGRAELPPFVKPNGEPTRFALSVHAWGEKVPRTEAAARKIAEKGRKLLERYPSPEGQRSLSPVELACPGRSITTWVEVSR